MPAPVRVALGDTARITARTDSIEADLIAHPERVRVFATVGDDSTMVEVKDSTSWPDDYATAYTIGYDTGGHVIYHLEAPRSLSGDWHAETAHYLDADGRVLMYDFAVAAFGAGCADLLREERRIYFAPDGSILHEWTELTDGDGHPVVERDCYRRSGLAAPARHSVREQRLPPPSSDSSLQRATPN